MNLAYEANKAIRVKAAPPIPMVFSQQRKTTLYHMLWMFNAASRCTMESSSTAGSTWVAAQTTFKSQCQT